MKLGSKRGEIEIDGFTLLIIIAVAGPFIVGVVKSCQAERIDDPVAKRIAIIEASSSLSDKEKKEMIKRVVSSGEKLASSVSEAVKTPEGRVRLADGVITGLEKGAEAVEKVLTNQPAAVETETEPVCTEEESSWGGDGSW